MKRFYADDSAATSVKVGHRQASYKKKTPQKCGVFFRPRFLRIHREVFFENGLLMLIDFHFSRHDSEELALP
ncbi:hypothetical protein F1735_29695 [Massilia sp. CCM 8694]|uniref:Uncharacterized protein n=1 Tax=Massilia genomosp. 1 TaxID=2609280 RepID=A0ABX0MVC3_9BURK|nr:hypothetical protein [Massilia genomosp. 1]